jgi:TetR/AcrR family transcriptional regulator
MRAKRKARGSRHQPEQTRRAILQAAAREFATEGVAGARTEHIARAAGVNKALLYYYFKDKETLYGAVLDWVFSGLTGALHEVLQREMPPRDKLLCCAATYFDYIAGSPFYPRLFLREIMRAGRNGSPHIKRVAERYMQPVFGEMARLIHDGIAAGEFRAVDPMQFVPSMVALVVFYFGGAPVLRAISGSDPLAPERIAARRAAVLDFISAAIFRQGSEAAAGPHTMRARQGVRA